MANEAGDGVEKQVELGSDLVIMAGREIKGLRDQHDWSQATLASTAEMSRRTVVEAEQSRPVTRDSAVAISKAFGITDNRLFVPVNVVSPTAQTLSNSRNFPQVLELKIDLGGVIGGDLKQAAALKELIGFLQRLLPDKAGVVVISTISGSAVIGIRHSPANEAVIRDPRLYSQLKGFGVNRLEFVAQAQAPQFLNPKATVESDSSPRATSETVYEVPISIPSLSSGKIMSVWKPTVDYYDEFQSRLLVKMWNILSGDDKLKCWEDLGVYDQLLLVIKYHEHEMARRLSEVDWTLIGQSKRSWLELSYTNLHMSAECAYGAASPDDDEIRWQYRRLMLIAEYRHILEVVRDLLYKISQQS